MRGYRTVAAHAVAELEVRRSRFVCAVWPVEDREQAEDRIRDWTGRHPRADHHAFAFRVGVAGLVEGCSDGGEPPGTAGRPALAVLRHQDLRNVVLVVTRYFGGVLLGTGGLVRAYGDAARAGVAAAGVIAMVPGWRWRLEIPHALWGRTAGRIAALGGRVEDVAFGPDGVDACVWVPAGRDEELARLLAGEGGGRVVWRGREPAYGPAPGQGTGSGS